MGLHAGYRSYNDLRTMGQEKIRFDQVVNNRKYGCRQHFLRWRTPETWRIQERLGLLYDTTVSFADREGFRCGICLPFRPYDVLEDRVLDVWELPLTVMDGTLQNPNYRGLTPEQAFDEVVKHVETVKKSKGVFVLLWHNSSFDRLGGWEGWREVYEKVMEYMASQGPFVENGRGIIEWWAERSKQCEEF